MLSREEMNKHRARFGDQVEEIGLRLFAQAMDRYSHESNVMAESGIHRGLETLHVTVSQVAAEEIFRLQAYIQRLESELSANFHKKKAKKKR